MSPSLTNDTDDTAGLHGDAEEAASSINNRPAATQGGKDPSNHSGNNIVSALFTRSAQVLQEPPMEVHVEDQNQQLHQEVTKSRRPRRVFDMSTPLKAALQEFLAMFQGPLPQDVIAALTAAFNLNDPVDEELDETVARVAGDAIDDIQGEAIQAGAGDAIDDTQGLPGYHVQHSIQCLPGYHVICNVPAFYQSKNLLHASFLVTCLSFGL
ncbi:uncharacterized protein LOC111257733 [Setaria italica]|uniref:uncharacterized protein LOC111257733 n=1 Tax=Setaria italica TaxID=4555 RepID=UPI000BE5C1A3|nr:uncharacterized protein LOC111257733 [Setaria italica]